MLRLFGHYIPKSLFLLIILEACLLYASMYLGAHVRDRLSGAVTSDQSLFYMALVFCFVTLTMLTAMGLYQRHLREGIEGMLLRMGVGLFLSLLILSLLFYLDNEFFPSGNAFGLGFSIAVLGLVITRIIFFKLVDHENLKTRILVMGTGKRAASIDQLKRSVDRRGFQLVGFVHMRGDANMVDKSKVLPLTTTLLGMCEEYLVDEIVVAVDDRRMGFPVEEILDCKMSGIKVIDKLTFFERQMGKLLISSLHPSWLIFSEGFRRGTFRHITKRLFDISASLVLLLLTSPLMIITAVLIFLESGFRGPVLYRQVRVGQNWKLFQVLKFRSMKVDAEKDGAPQWATRNDARVTRIGSVIRKIRVDELPQILNVLMGDMSFVGPRPERPMFVEQLTEKIPYYAERHRVKPGITGWAQILYPYGASEQDAIEKLQYDLYYVKNYSLFLDLMILFQTAEVILWGKGAR